MNQQKILNWMRRVCYYGGASAVGVGIMYLLRGQSFGAVFVCVGLASMADGIFDL
ncbi:MAG: hypothetical protein K9N51_06450 [Candidatus Pacebacteria bacterium]|nr:hypothetical protein [Candidatus Paceibacterota bacterium]